MNKKNTQPFNRYLEKEQLLKQFNKKTVTIEQVDKSDYKEKMFEFAFKDHGGVTVVLINGAGESIEGWMKLWPLLEHKCSLFAYNRLGIDKSSEPQEPQNAVQMVEDLRILLKSVGIKAPYVLVGHSLGCFIAHVFASTFPQEVLGVVFLEASTVEDAACPKTHVKKLKKYPFAEVNCIEQTIYQVHELPTFPQIPVAVIASLYPLSRMLLPRKKFLKHFEHQKKLLDLSAQSSLIVAAKSGRFPQMSEPKLVAESIYNMVII